MFSFGGDLSVQADSFFTCKRFEVAYRAADESGHFCFFHLQRHRFALYLLEIQQLRHHIQ